MHKYFLFMFSMLFVTFLSYSQSVSISTDNVKYNIKDTINLKLVNGKSMDLVYALGLEADFNSKWTELEPTINMKGKVERFDGLKKLKTKIIKIVLPAYLINMTSNGNSLTIRFRLKEGLTFGKLDTVYSLPISISMIEK